MPKSTKLIAGAGVVALLGVAALPGLAGAADFTDITTQTDTLKVNIENHCTFGKFYIPTDGSTVKIDPAKHEPGVGTWGTSDDTLTGMMVNGTKTDNFGSTTLSVYCSGKTKYNITATASTGADLVGQTDSNNKIPANASYSATTTGWAYKATGDGSRITSFTAPTDAGAIIAESANIPTSANPGSQYKITYGLGVSKTQAADTYIGNITYTLAGID